MPKLGVLRKISITVVACTAWTLAASAQTFTTVHSFDDSDGSIPNGLILATDGNFYGTTQWGGAYSAQNCCGTVFRITPAGTLTSLYSFCAQSGCPDGTGPLADLLQATDGNFYGTTYAGGAFGGGTAFRITPAGTLTTLYSFCTPPGCLDGQTPIGRLVQAADRNFYGTTYWGGSSANCKGGCGTVFRITPSGTLTTLHSFDNTDGANPQDAGLILAPDGNFYGTTFSGGASANCKGGCGTIYRITPLGVLTSLHSFDNTDGANPNDLIQAADGTIYGTTDWGGAKQHGTVFKITGAGTLTTLYNFCSRSKCVDGASPAPGLMQAIDGNFYGTTYFGGPSSNCQGGCGTIFEITPTGTLATLRSFDSTDGWSPAGLVQIADRSFYGTTFEGGVFNTMCQIGCGTAFHLAVAPAVTLSSNSFNFGNQALAETSAAKTVTLKNSGSALLIMGNVAIEGSGFAVSADACSGLTLGTGKLCKVSVTFTPAALGKVTGKLTFTDNASNSPQTVSLSGTGSVPVTLKPVTATYATQTVGTTSAAKTFTLTNYQNTALTGISISTTGDFAVSSTTCATSLGIQNHCTINVTFTPTAVGTRKGTLRISDSATNSPQISSLTGTGK